MVCWFKGLLLGWVEAALPGRRLLGSELGKGAVSNELDVVPGHGVLLLAASPAQIKVLD